MNTQKEQKKNYLKVKLENLKNNLVYLSHVKLIDVWYYIQGTYRYACYVKAPYLLRGHIIEQFHDRLVAAEDCLMSGKCKMCGCKTPELFFADKPCSLSELTIANRKKLFNTTEICYIRMLNKKEYLNSKTK